MNRPSWTCGDCGKSNDIDPELATCWGCGRASPAVFATTVPVPTPTSAVDHPAHYGGDTTYETIKVLEAWFTPEQMTGFNLGNAVKYISRAGKKGATLEDLQKARWYLDREISRREAK